MKMNMLPFAMLPMPDPRFLHGHRDRFSIGQLLRQPDVGDDADITDDANMGADDGRLNRIGGCMITGSQIEVVLVKIQSIDQVPNSLGFKARQAGTTKFFVGVPISPRDAQQKLLGQFEDCVAVCLQRHRSFQLG